MDQSQGQATDQRQKLRIFDFDLFEGPSNAEIFGHLRSQEVKISQHPRIKVRRISSFLRPRRWIPRRAFTAIIRSMMELDPRLPLPELPHSAGHLRDVYLLTRPDTKASVFILSWQHWSVYCGGRIYHLTADSASGLNSYNASMAPAASLLPVRLKIDLCHASHSPAEKPLAAYHIGQTDLNDVQLAALF
jgi:hypothetical protein